MAERGFFQTGNLRLTDADFARNLHLGAPLKEAQVQDALLALVQAIHGLADGDVLQPVFGADVVVAHLIADGQRVRALAADRLAQAYGVLDGFEREGDVLRRQLERFPARSARAPARLAGGRARRAIYRRYPEANG